tara:strand:- start:657 stop:1412 length:756 start_codon:yes stop_codon:yes gene_type:complete
MAELTKVQINEKTEEENISLEKQAEMQEAMKQDAELAKEENRPDWLPEKFENEQDLANAYAELEKKQSASDTDKSDAKSETEENTDGINDVIAKATDVFAEKGELADKDYNALAKVGIPREMVDAYIRGQEALVSSQELEVQEVVGGGANYEAMTDWASENLSETEIEAFDEVVTAGTVDQAKMAVQGLYARFVSSGGKPPNVNQGAVTGSSVKPFGSAAQVTEAMADPRYQNDPAYRQQVERRLAVSNAF